MKLTVEVTLAILAPVPEALLKLMFPARVSVPVAEIFACVLEFTWKLTKSPWKVELGFAPIYVPVVFEFWIGFRPSWKRAELVEIGGMAPVRRRAVCALRVDWMYPVARKFVEETDARFDWPPTLR